MEIVLTPQTPWNGNFHSFFIFSTLMASLSEMCRGLSVPSIDIVPINHKIRMIGFVYPWSHMHPNNPNLRLTKFNFWSTRNFPTNNLVNRWVKLSHSLERKMMGYVSIKLFLIIYLLKSMGKQLLFREFLCL